MRAAIWTTLLCLALMPSARAATFDCDKASTFAEKVVCSDSRLSAMDHELGRLYKAALAGASNSAALKTDQKAWLSSRDRCQDSDCIKKAYADRISALKGSSADTAGSVTGTYKMKNGEVRVQQTANGRIKFSINATYQMNVGEVSGEAPLTGSAASYADGDNDCALSFKFASAKLVVSQDGSCGMGLNVSASGTYNRVSTAPPKFDE
jgi:uncharacterized protein